MRQSSDTQVVEKQFSSLIYLIAHTARSFDTSWSCAPRCGTTRFITSGPWGLRCRSRTASSWLPAGLLPGFSGQAKIVRFWRLLGHKGAETICLGPHIKIQLCPERLARADALGRPLPLYRSWLIRRLSAWKRRDPHSRKAGIGAAATSRDKTC